MVGLQIHNLLNTRAEFNPTASSKLCSTHFPYDSFETQSVIAQSVRLKMKRNLKPNVVPTIFKRNSGLPQKKLSGMTTLTSRKTTGTHYRTGPLCGKPKSKTGALTEKEKLHGYILKIKFKIGILIFMKPSNKWYPYFVILSSHRWTRKTLFYFLWRAQNSKCKQAPTSNTRGWHPNCVTKTSLCNLGQKLP